MKTFMLLASTFLTFAPVLRAQTRTAAQTEREIAAVRAVYQEITQAASTGRLMRRDSTVRCSPDDLEQEVTRWTDLSGTIRQLTWMAGSDDHAETQRFYYDGSGRLRFVFVSRGAVNGTQEEERVYYAADGRLLRRRKTRVEGPGYGFGDPQPVWHPNAWLRSLCSGGR